MPAESPGAPARQFRNPGPSWGYPFLRACDYVLPEVVYKPLRAIGTWIGVACMPAQRRYSRDYLRCVLGREPTLRDVFRHFFALEESLLLKLRVINGREHHGDFATEGSGFREWLEEGFPVLLGTFHVGVSDLLGFILGQQERRKIHIVRLQVGNSHDIDRLVDRFGRWVKIIWVNDPGEMQFALKRAAEEADGIAMQCDRVEFSARSAEFDFLGAKRLFPITIYYLAHVFQRPVVLSVGVQVDQQNSVLYDSPVFRPDPDSRREENVRRGKAHFQEFLHQLESILRSNPYIWFNFLPFASRENGADH